MDAITFDASTQNDTVSEYTNLTQTEAHASALSLRWHVLIITTFTTCSLLGNGGTIYLHIKHRNKYKCKTYVIALAVLDLFACAVPLPLFPYLDISASHDAHEDLVVKTFYTLMSSISVGYSLLLLLIAFDRFLAVCFPYVYHKYYNLRAVVSLVVILILSIAEGVYDVTYRHPDHEEEGHDEEHEEVHVISLQWVIILWTMIVFIYVIIIINLYKQGRKIAESVSIYKSSSAVQTSKRHTFLE